jgi:FkbM family methyltransferase
LRGTPENEPLVQLLRLLQDSRRILRGNGPVRREDLLHALWRLQFQAAVANGATRLRRERFAGMTVEFFDYASLTLLFHEVFVNQAYTFRSPRPDPLIVDAGGNIGMAVLYFKRLYPQARVLSFEPEPVTFAVLERNVQANQLAGVTLCRAALVAQPGALPLYTDPARNGAPYASTRAPLVAMCAGHRTPRPVEVEGVRLSDRIEGPVDFLKLDIEGAEHAVLEDLAHSGKLGQVREMVMECHHHIRPDEDRLAPLLSLLEANSFGYQISSGPGAPGRPGDYQNLMIRAYQRSVVQTGTGAARDAGMV